MRVKLILYWVTTALITLESLVGGLWDLTYGHPKLLGDTHVVEVVTSLGYPAYMLAIIGIGKIPGAITLVVPGFLRLKEWAYAGIVFELAGAVISQAMCGHRSETVVPLFLLGLALASWALRPPSRIVGKSLWPGRTEA